MKGDVAPRRIEVLVSQLKQNMTARSRTTAPLVSAAFGAMLLVAVPAPGSCEPVDSPTVRSDPRPAAPPSSKPAKPAQRTGASQNSRTPAAQRQQEWTLQDALPDHSPAMRQYEPQAKPGLGRVPLQSGPGSFGFETENKVKPLHTPDGRIIPGLDGNAGRSSSYLGLSLSVPTTDKAMGIPVPWGRP
jgi:hypothetical protein